MTEIVYFIELNISILSCRGFSLTSFGIPVKDENGCVPNYFLQTCLSFVASDCSHHCPKIKLISRKHVKQFALDMAAQRAHKFTRVGGPFFIRCEANLQEFIRSYVRHLPSKGKTIL